MEKISMFTTTTKKGTEGHGISYSDEVLCAEALGKVLPKGWKISFSWAQILFSDVQYNIEEKTKTIEITYNQNLRHWYKSMVAEINKKLKTVV